jgi:hypothetical protein
MTREEYKKADRIPLTPDIWITKKQHKVLVRGLIRQKPFLKRMQHYIRRFRWDTISFLDRTFYKHRFVNGVHYCELKLKKYFKFKNS